MGLLGCKLPRRVFWRDTCLSRNRVRVVKNECAGVYRHIGKLRAFALAAASLGCTYVPVLCFASDNAINDIAAIGHRNAGWAKGTPN
jgi:hypothetical protein